MIKLKSGCIYRCNPTYDSNNLQFNVSAYRYDKKKPNPGLIINNIMNLILYNWESEVLELDTFYYGETKHIITNTKLKQFLSNNINILEDQLLLLRPEYNKKWLDLGCGSGKLVNMIKKYNPSYYVGLDSDVKQLTCALKYHDMMQDNYIFNPCNLTKQWDKNEITWYDMNIIMNKKFDYIVANFSLMHFCCDIFWSELNKNVNIGTQFMFNLVSIDNMNIDWSESKSFLKKNNDIISYYFEWTHDKIMEEKFITYNMLQEYLSKYNWTIKSKYNPKGEYVNLYTWIIAEKI
jgi:SAM-dependent methyltransferase